MYIIEFQKHDLPHAHILLILILENKLWFVTDYDSIISTEILDPITHSLAYEIVINTMIHNLCGIMNPKASYMKDDVC